MAKKKTKTKKQTDSDSTPVPFETSLEQLRSVVSELENGNLTLSESLEHYERGVKNLKSCYDSLEQAKQKIELLVDLDDNGNLITRQFDNTATSRPSRKTTRQAAVEEEYEDEEDDDEYETDDDVDIDDPNSLF
jgi:exodeoxyribonuclease VII small subunit